VRILLVWIPAARRRKAEPSGSTCLPGVILAMAQTAAWPWIQPIGPFTDSSDGSGYGIERWGADPHLLVTGITGSKGESDLITRRFVP